MRFIHTADWHLGNQMHDIDRREEEKAFLTWLRLKIIEKNAESLIISGDIFDSHNPPVEERKFYYNFLASLQETACKNIIVIAGNHDSAFMLDSAKEILDFLNIHIVGSVNNLTPSQMCFELFDDKKNVNAICMAVPFVRETELRNYVQDSKIEDKNLYLESYKSLYSMVFEEAKKLRAERKVPIIATGHLYAAELEGRLSEKKSNEKTDDGVKVLDVLGTLGNVPPEVFPDADYIALGHIHYSSMVAKNPKIRYSGSPFIMGFDEALIKHNILCVDLNENNSDGKFSLNVEKIEVPELFSYIRISGTLHEIRKQLLTFKPETKNHVFLELHYKREFGVNAREYLEDAVVSLPENVSVVSWKISDSNDLFFDNKIDNFDSNEIKNLDDKEIFKKLILTKTALSENTLDGKMALEKFLPLFMKILSEIDE